MHVTVTHTAQNTAKIASKYREHVLTVHMRNRAHTLVFIWGRLLFLIAGIRLTALCTSAKFGGLFSDAKWSRKNVSSSCYQAVLCFKYARHKLNNILTSQLLCKRLQSQETTARLSGTEKASVDRSTNPFIVPVLFSGGKPVTLLWADMLR